MLLDRRLAFPLRRHAATAGSSVTVRVRGLLGVISIFDGGTVSLNGSWRPSPRVSLLLTNIGGLLTTKAISLRFTAIDGTAQIDDVYVDPWVST